MELTGLAGNSVRQMVENLRFSSFFGAVNGEIWVRQMVAANMNWR